MKRVLSPPRTPRHSPERGSGLGRRSSSAIPVKMARITWTLSGVLPTSSKTSAAVRWGFWSPFSTPGQDTCSHAPHHFLDSFGDSRRPSGASFQIGGSLTLLQSVLPVASTKCFLTLSPDPDTLLLKSFSGTYLAGSLINIKKTMQLHGGKWHMPWELKTRGVACGHSRHLDEPWKVKRRWKIKHWV